MKKHQGENVWVTGGAGFLGPHLIARLLKEGWRVTAIDNFFNGRPEHIRPFQSDPNFTFLKGDITNPVFLAKAADEHAPDMIYHLAALHFIPYCISNPAETLFVNVVGTQRLLDVLEEHPISHFVLASTADVYLASDAPHSETDDLGSSNVYGMTKLCCEALLGLCRQRHTLVKFFSTRFFNIFGPGETNPHVLPDILAELSKGNVLRLGNMTPRRDYIHVRDVADALFRILSYKGDERIFNVGTGAGTSVSDLVKTLERIVGYAIRIEVDPAKVRPVERQNLVADISRIRRELHWTPSVSIEEGLRELLTDKLPAELARRL